jgi:uncharacterized protein YbbC (DUF1343 family)
MHRVRFLVWGAGVTFLAGCAPSASAYDADLVRPGLEVLVTDSLHLVQGLRVGLLTNQAGVDHRGVSAVEVLLAAGVRLTALFSPEHGFRGQAAPGEAVNSTSDSATGLPIYSLYGATPAPTAEMLAMVDVILVDLQDVGARYYTWLATVIRVLTAAEQHGVSVIILDRPNPIGGMVQGNILDTSYRSPVGMLAVPMRHGLSFAELVRLGAADLGVASSFGIVPIDGWDRNQFLDEIGLPFIPPSPNLKDVEALFHYPGLCLFEATGLSVGRGTDAPFHQIGIPELDTVRVLAAVRAAGVPGVRFTGTSFTPRNPGDGKFGDTTVVGVRLKVTDRSRYDPVLAAVTLLDVVRRVHPFLIAIDSLRFDRLAGGPVLRAALQRGVSPSEIVSGWDDQHAEYLARRRPSLLYPLYP